MFILVAILYFTAMRVDTMDVDASQYAEISREMMVSGDYLHVYDRGIDYLDKPPFHFWASAASMKVFGVNNFGYKFPSILFALWALWATYKLGRRLYGDAIGRMAALVLATCQGMFLWTNDVRCDTILLSCVVTALWLIQEWVETKKLSYLLGGSVAIALGMMTKGPIALIVPVLCFSCDWILKRQWKTFFSPAFIPALLVIAILLIPMSIGLYQQFDLHPEKIVNGATHVSGLRFFYWSQSFGRITGESPWSNGAGIDFLMLNMLWAFLPWIFLFLTALVLNIKTLFQQKLRLQEGQEWITTGGFILTYLALGSSAYQLPHYLFVVFPLAAIITAKLLYDMIEDGKYSKLFRVMTPVHIVIMFLLLGAVLALVAYVFKGGISVIIVWCIGMVLWLYLVVDKNLKGKLFWLPAIGIFAINIFLTNIFYYNLLQYQLGSQVGRFIHSRKIDPGSVGIYKVDDPVNAIQFYAQGSIKGIDTITQLQPATKYLVTMDDGLQSLAANKYSYTMVYSNSCYKVSEMTPDFLNPATRNKAVKKYYLVKIN